MSNRPTGSRYALTADELERTARIDRLAAQGPEGIAPLVDLLDDPSWTVRRAVVAALAAAGDVAVRPLARALSERRTSEGRIAATVDALAASVGEADPVLIRMAESPVPAVAADAAQILGRRHTLEGVPALVRLTKHADDNVAVAAIEALGRVGGRAAVDSLVAAVAGGNFFRAFPAIDVLGRSGDPRAIAPLTALLEQPQLAAEAARALGRTGERVAVAPLVRLLERAGSATARIAALALDDLRRRYAERFGAGDEVETEIRAAAGPGGGKAAGRQLLRALSDGEPEEVAAICFVLGALGDASSAPALVAYLDAPAPVAHAASEALKRLGPDAEEQVLQRLREGDSSAKAALLPLISRGTAVGQVELCLGDPEPQVRAAACEALGRIGARDAVRALFPLLADGNPRVSFAALGAIQALGGHETEALALAAAVSVDARLRRAAVRILSYFGFPSATRALLAALGDADERVRESAIAGLPFVEDPRALEALLGAAKDPSERTRAAAMRALAQCSGDMRVSAALMRGIGDANPWVRYYACQALGKLAFEPAADAIAALLADQAGQVRVAAIEALACLESPSATAVLLRAAEDAEPDIQRAALIGLGVAGHPEAIAAIAAATRSPDPTTRLVALSAISAFDGDETIAALSRAAADPDESVRTAAIGFLSSKSSTAATRALADLIRTARAKEPIVAALSVHNAGRIPGLLEALAQADDETAAALTSALARMRRPEAQRALISVMSTANSRARKAAASALSTTATRQSTAALKAAAAEDPDPEVRQVCALLLGR